MVRVVIWDAIVVIMTSLLWIIRFQNISLVPAYTDTRLTLKILHGQTSMPVQWRHNECLCEWNPQVTGEFPSQRASNAEMFSFDHVIMAFQVIECFVVCGNGHLALKIVPSDESLHTINIFAYTYGPVKKKYTLFPPSVINGQITSRGPFYLHGLTLISTLISNYIHFKVWDEITYPFLNFNGATVEV